jgi:hypothetical protein
VRRLLPVVLVCSVLLTGAVDAPVATMRRERRVENAYRRGVARFGGGWIFSGTNGLWRTADNLHVETTNTSPIPADLRARGYNRMGDVDVAGAYLYVPLEQPDDARNEQVTARFDAKTLEFIDAVTLRQHENSFVAVDAHSGTAYSMDRFGGDTLLRYDLGGLRWRALPPLHLDRRVENVQGADLGDGFAYLSTSDPRNSLYRVDLGSGEVIDLGSAGHAGGEGEGIDVTPLATGRVHTLTIDTDKVSVLLGDFSAPPPRKTGTAERVIIGITVAATLIAAIVVVALTRRRGHGAVRKQTGQ